METVKPGWEGKRFLKLQLEHSSDGSLAPHYSNVMCWKVPCDLCGGTGKIVSESINFREKYLRETPNWAGKAHWCKKCNGRGCFYEQI